MDTILQCSNHIPQRTFIDNQFIEQYMLEANGSYVKVYLYLAKCIQNNETGISISFLADRMEHTEGDILRALAYWEKKQLMTIYRNEQGDVTGIDMLPPPADSTTQKAPVSIVSDPKPAGSQPDIEPAITQVPKTETSAKSTMTVGTMQYTDLSKDKNFCWLSNVIESYLNHPLLPGELRLLSFLYVNLQFSNDLILYLYEYCISLGKTNTNYMQAIALSWHEQGVKTPDEAQAASTAYNSTYNAIAKALGLGRALLSAEKKYIDRWQNEWGMDLSVIIEACNRTIIKIHKADFPYTEGILDKWHQNHVHTLQDVKRADETYSQNKQNQAVSTTPNQSHTTAKPNTTKNQFHNFLQRDISDDQMNDLERALLQQSISKYAES